MTLPHFQENLKKYADLVCVKLISEIYSRNLKRCFYFFSFSIA